MNKVRNVKIVPLACADRDAIELFVDGENNALGRLAGNDLMNEPGSKRPETTLVSTVTLDSVVEKLQISPDVIKIDVEGAELRVLQGAKNILSQVRPTILLSVHSDQLREACLDFCNERHYRVSPLNAPCLQTATEFLAQARR